MRITKFDQTFILATETITTCSCDILFVFQSTLVGISLTCDANMDGYNRHKTKDKPFIY